MTTKTKSFLFLTPKDAQAFGVECASFGFTAEPVTVGVFKVSNAVSVQFPSREGGLVNIIAATHRWE